MSGIPTEVPALPANWLTALREQKCVSAPPAPNLCGRSHLLQRAQKYAASVPGASEGNRNDAAFSIAGNIAAFVGDDGERLDEADILDVVRTWNARCSSPLPDEELRKCVNSAGVNGTPRKQELPHHRADKSASRRQKTGNVSASTALKACAPFPIHTLPSPVRDFVRAASQAIGCDPAFIALPVLACLARAIGNSCVIRLKKTWLEYAIFWAAIVGKSGTHKTPALQAAMKFLDQLQDRAFVEWEGAMQVYQRDKTTWERDIAQWKKRGHGDEEPPERPVEPICTRFLTSDCTIEALALILSQQFDGLLVARDELAGWINGIAEYKGGKGSDLGHWLACWSAQSFTVDRKTGAIKTLHVRRGAVSLVGGIQPGVLKAAIGREHLQDGLCARLLMAMPASVPVVWTDATIDEWTEQAMCRLFDVLATLKPVENEQTGQLEPKPLGLSAEAKAVWVQYFNRHRAEIGEMEEDLTAASSKLEAYTARFALVFQLCQWAAGDAGAGNQIDEVSMRAAIELSDWFGGEAKRVYALFGETDEESDRRELVELLRRKGGRVTVRKLMRASSCFSTADLAEAALNDLVRSGLGTWEIVSTCTNNRREFVLSEQLTTVTLTDSPDTADIDECVSVNGVSAPAAHRNGHDPDVVNRFFSEAEPETR